MNNARVLLILIMIVLGFGALVYRLINLQVVRSDELSYFAKRQQMNSQTVRADRGFIYDRNDVLLVYNRNDYSFYVDLRMLPNSEKPKLAEMFSETMGKSKRYYLNILKATGKTICIEKKVPFEKSLNLFEYKNPAYFYVEEPVCVFHYGSLASHILGYVDNEYRGVNGISKSFNEVLKGKDGYRMVERDAMGEIISISETETKPSQPGDDIYLTIDKRYQAIVEEELKSSLRQTRGESATCILMDPNSGKILSMANVEDYDPNYYWKYDDFQRKNRAITDSYEPGSTFKAFTFAALFEEELCNDNEKVNTENGVYKYRGNYIKDSHKFEWLTVRGVIEESSNIGTAKLVQRISDEKYYQYVRSFGFGTYTSVALPGEVTGKLVDLSQWKAQTKTYMSFGYNISVTPLQLTSAFAALVNGGVLYQPQIIERLVNKNGEVISENSPIVVRRVISEKTSEKMRKILQGVVDHGTGKQAKIDSISVGGKTGTSKLVVNGKYSNDQYYSSFIGFYPVEKPEIVCYVLINKPKGDYYGGLVSAPVFKNIIKRIHSLEKGKVQPGYNDDLKLTEKNDFQNEVLTVHKNNTELTDKNKNVFVFGSNTELMPDLRGMTIKEAVLILNDRGVKWSISGSGVVVDQSIPAGQIINKRKTCVLNCSQITAASTRIY